MQCLPRTNAHLTQWASKKNNSATPHRKRLDKKRLFIYTMEIYGCDFYFYVRSNEKKLNFAESIKLPTNESHVTFFCNVIHEKSITHFNGIGQRYATQRTDAHDLLFLSCQ